jgi:hypothetical protein
VGRNFVITNSNSQELGRKKKTISSQLVIGPNALKFITLAIVTILGVVYLSQSTAGASRSIKVRDIEDKKASLMLEQERLEAEQTRLRSLKEIDNGVEKPALEPVSSVDHSNANHAVARSN